MPTRRSRVVNFRLQPKEYESLKEYCEKRGATSISDVARTAVQCLIESDKQGTREEKVAIAIRDLESKIDALDRRMLNARGELANEVLAERHSQELPREEPNGTQ